MVIGAAGTPAAMPPKAGARGYKGRIYHNHGVGNSDACAQRQECGAPSCQPVRCWWRRSSMVIRRRGGAGHIERIGRAVGSVTAFGAYAWDAGLLCGRPSRLC